MEQVFTSETASFKFAGYSFRFKYTPGQPLVYIFATEESAYAMAAIPLKSEMERTLDNAKEIGRSYLRHWVNDLGFASPDEYLKRRRERSPISSPPTPPKPKLPPSGPHCKKCLKPDEGDLVPDLSGEGEICITCHIKGASK